MTMDVVFSAYSGLDVQTKIVDTIANNLANVQTTGFKRDFAQILESEYGNDLATRVDLSPGRLMPTGNDLDVAIEGRGFFAVQTPAGVRYTRAGNFVLDTEGDLVTPDGMKVLSTSNSPINASGGNVSIRDGGEVVVDGSEVATLKVVDFGNPAKLEKEGMQRFIWRGEDLEVQNLQSANVRSGHLEGSNVNAVSEMVRMISAYREFESIQRAVATANNDMTGKLVSDSGQLG
jgi:flagellar basal-body rod protein FlgG